MTDWRSTVNSQAEQVVEYHGLSAHDVEAVETLTDDPLFQELALSYHRARLAYETALNGEDQDLSQTAFNASDDLLGALRDRGADLLDVEPEQETEGSA